MPRSYWLMKSEPGAFSIDDLKNSPKKTTTWEGVRNYQARNIMRDLCKKGDGVLFYHSKTKEPAIVGLASVVKESYPDPTQFDSKSPYFDPKATADKPRWFMVDVKYESHFKTPVTLAVTKHTKALTQMVLVNRGRLSVQPVTAQEWDLILKMGES